MRNRILILGAAAAIALAGWSCSDKTAVRIRYQAEKMYYAANKALTAAEFRGDVDDPAVARNLRDQFSAVAAYGFAALDTVTPAFDQQENRQLSGIVYQSTSRLAQMYFAARRYDTLVVLIERLIDKATLNRTEQATTWYNFGRALQVGGRRDSSLSVYTTAIDKFVPPVNDSGHVLLLVFNLPLRIHQAFVDGQDSASAAQWYARAEAYYQKWSATSGQPTELSMTSLGNLGRLYEDAQEWSKAAATLHQMVDSTGAIAPVPKLHIADLYAEKLGRYDDAIALYDELDRILVGPDTAARPQIYEKRAGVYLNKKDYAKAREILNSIESRWPGYFKASPDAQYTKARTFELENNWGRAETEYRYLIDHYPGSEPALAAYLYLAGKAEKEGREAEAEQWYSRAEKAYKTIIAQKPGTRDEALALYFLADLHRQKKQWSEAATTLSQVFQKFPETIQGLRAASMAADVYRDKLGNTRTADSLEMAVEQAALARSTAAQ